MSTVVPRLVVAAPASGHGKTTVTTGLLAAYAARGLRVSPHKVGPDYIDPGYHALAAGRPGRNLDPYLVGTHLIGPLFANGCAGADLAVVEGVMGLYDGAAGHGELGSTAQVAAALRAPVVLVVDVSAQGRSVAALVHGFRTYEPSVWLAGVILNRVGSDRHEEILRAALDEIGVPVFGALRRRDVITTPSRHLGLVPVAERDSEAVAAVRRMGEVVEGGVDLDRLLWLARSAPPVSAEPWSAEYAVGGPASGQPVVAVAAGAAFSFGYAETIELLTGAGAQVALFDPLRDDALPEGTAALVIGGGFPEVYAEQLAANEPLKKAVRELASSGAPIAAECAGLLWLVRSLDGKPMCGVLDAEARMTDRLTLGYRTAVAVSDSALAAEGTRANGHVFHRTEVTPRAGGHAAWRWAGRPPEGFVQDGVHASYLHTHWAANPGMARRLVDTAARMVQTMRQPTEPIPLPAGGSTLIEDAGLDVAAASDVDADDVRTGVVEAEGVPAVAEPDDATAVSTTEALADGRTEADVSTTEALADGETAVDVSTTEPLVDAEPPEAVPIDQGLDDEDADTAPGDGSDVGTDGASGPAADDKGRSGSDSVTSGRRGEQPRWASEFDSADDERGPVGGER